MSSLVIWIDRRKARLFHFSPAGLRREVHHFHGKTHPREAHGRNHPLRETDEYRFYHELADRLARFSEQEWVVFGPSLARIHFQRFIEEHRPELKSRLIGSDVAPPESDGRLLDRARSFFRQFRLFQGFLPSSKR